MNLNYLDFEQPIAELEDKIDALESIKDYKIPFGESILSWGPEKHLGANDAFLFVVQDGKFVQVDDVMYTY